MQLNFKEQFGPKIQKINDAIVESLALEDETRLLKAMKHLPLAGGKRLRPILSMLVADAISKCEEKALPFGVSLELIHNFTLVHDDLMDNDDMRRGIPTVHTEFDDYTAINAGDGLFARAFEILADVEVQGDNFHALLRDVASTVRLIGEGQQLDKDFESCLDITEADYMKMVEYKTAVLFRMATKGGAVVAGGTPEQVSAMAEYGRLIGIGFQICDDLIDITSSEEKLGKPFGSDIKNGKRTIMVVRGLAAMDEAQKEKFLATFGKPDASADDVRTAVKLLDDVGSIDHAQKLALDYSEEAKHLLEVLPECESREVLARIADFMVEREH